MTAALPIPPPARRGALLAAGLALALAWPVHAPAADDVGEFSWTLSRALRDVHGVFPHPADPRTAWAATASGLFKTADAGRTWQAIPTASAARLGVVSHLVCCPADDNRLLAGTDANGLFLSTDGGKTWKRLGSDADQPASAHVAWVDFDPIDPSWRTILLTHGLSAPGISISRDLGKTWAVFGTDRYLRGFAKDGDTIIAAGSMVQTEGKTWGIHRSGWDGQRWEECNRGLQPSEVALATFRPVRFMFATRTGRILTSSDDGRTWYDAAQVADASWVSVFFTNGPTDATEVLAAYDPYRHGLVLSARRFRAGSRFSRNRGLYVGPFVKSGARCRANANGSVFYAVLNDALWIARRVPSGTGPTVALAMTRAPMLWLELDAVRAAEEALHARIARAAGAVSPTGSVSAIAGAYRDLRARRSRLGFTVLAKVVHPAGPTAVKAVTVDLSLLGGPRDAELYDDGKHDDGAPGDGLWARRGDFSPDRLGSLPPGDPRPPLPGRSALTVTAFDASGASDSWSAPLAVHRRPETLSLWPGGRGLRFPSTLTEGPVSVRDAGEELIFSAAGPGPWRGAWIMGAGGMNISGRRFLTFEICGSVNQELYVHLVDRYFVGSDIIDEPHFSRGAPLLGGGYLKAITPTFQKVRIPVSRLLPKRWLFLRKHGAGIALSAGANAKPAEYAVRKVQLDP